MKKAFTVAEVLITIGIIGVIASLTLPALQVNYMKYQIPIKLAKAMNTLESTSRQALLDNNLTELPDVGDILGSRTDVFGVIFAQYLQYHVEPLDQTAYDREIRNGLFGDCSLTYTTKDGITYIPKGFLTIKKDYKNPRFSKYYYHVTVDINGPRKGPNKSAVDIFKFLLDGKGNAIAHGSMAYAEYTNSDTYNWEKQCNPRKGRSGIACTGSIVDNGFNVVYDLKYIMSKK